MPPIAVRLETIGGIPIAVAALRFASDDDDVTFNFPRLFTNADGEVVTAAAAGTVAGATTFTVSCDDCGAAPLTIDATIAAGTASSLRVLPPASVTRPAAMTVEIIVTDAFGNATADGAITVGVTAAAPAVFTGATQGALVSGEGTGAVTATTSAGRLTLTVTSVDAGLIAFVASADDVETFAGDIVRVGPVVLRDESSTPIYNDTFTAAFAIVEPIGADAVVEVTAFGDYGDSSEDISLVADPDGLAVPLAPWRSASGFGCAPAVTLAIPVPLASIGDDLVDGTVSVRGTNSGNVDPGVCSPSCTVSMTLVYPRAIRGEFF